jgi:hypothetical protein
MATKLKRCCAQFEGWYGEAGHRSLAVLIDRSYEGSAAFLLQHRAIEMGDEPRMGEELAGSTVPITLVGEVHIHFCPWCGRNLRRWYGKWLDALIRPGFRIAATNPG